MKKELMTLVLLASVAASLPLATLQAQMGRLEETGASVHFSGPIDRAVTRAAVRLASEDLTPSSVARTEQGGAAGDSAWLRLRRFEGEEIVLTTQGSRPGRRFVVRGTADALGLTVLDLTDPAIPEEVMDLLRDAAWDHPEYFRTRGSFRLDNHVRVAAGDVFVDDRKVLALDQVVQRVERSRVTEISVAGRAIKRGILWGALIGGVTGVAIVMRQCGTDWSHETSTCGNLSPIWLFFGPGMGIGAGSGLGAAFKSSTVVYHAP
jgi:hypothetical protein